MGDKFYPDRFLKQVMPKSFYTQGLVSKNFTLQKGAISAINRARLATGRAIDKTVYDVLLQYKAKYKDLIAAEDFGKAQAFEAAVGGENLLRQRIEQAVIFDKIQDLKAEHKGEYYRWMPSSAENPDPQHGLLYGKIFRVGEGDKEGNMPGERYGCQCGIEWLNSGENERERVLSRMPVNFLNSINNLWTRAITKDKENIVIPFGRKISGREARLLGKKAKTNVKGLKHSLVHSSTRHTYLHHGNEQIEMNRPKQRQTAVTEKDIALIPYIVKNYDSVELSPTLSAKEKLKVLIYKKRMGNRVYFYLEAIDNQRKIKMLKNQTMYIHVY